MKIITDPRVDKEIFRLSLKDQTKINEYIKLFKEYGFGLSQKYLKKIDKNIWELRPDKWRVFILEVVPEYIVIHLMRKQSQKMTKETKKILARRSKEYLWEK